jgi:ubiquinone/menaquinone biosynthesis C-methylase UbiE
MNKELDFVKDMFDRIAPKYDFLNRLLSLRQDIVWRTQMVKAAGLKKNSKILDIACGTCDVALEAGSQLKGQTEIFGLDFSFGMLELGKRKLKKQNNKSIRLINGDALHLPFRQGLFDAVFIAFGIRNIMNLKIPVIFIDFFINVDNSSQGPLQALIRPYNAHVIPHEPPDFIPVMGYDNGFITVRGTGFIP